MLLPVFIHRHSCYQSFGPMDHRGWWSLLCRVGVHTREHLFAVSGCYFLPYRPFPSNWEWEQLLSGRDGSWGAHIQGSLHLAQCSHVPGASPSRLSPAAPPQPPLPLQGHVHGVDRESQDQQGWKRLWRFPSPPPAYSHRARCPFPPVPRLHASWTPSALPARLCQSITSLSVNDVSQHPT